MTNTRPALLGGTPVRSTPFAPWRTIDAQDIAAATRVLESGVLSHFLGSWSDGFLGGPEIQALESEWARYFGVRHAVSVNSATSGLYAAIGALGLGPGDEVIVTPASMSASATAPLVYGAIPVFADIDRDTCTLSPDAVARVITPRTRAIVVVNLFGHPAHLDALGALAKQHNLFLIEDNAQAPGARFQGRFAGTIGDIGVFSLNCHKHVQTGEGGICVTNDDRLADRLRLIRNHAEAVVEAKGEADLTNMIGWNYRLTELQAAIARVQLAKLPNYARRKTQLGNLLAERLRGIDGLWPPTTLPHCEHVYYIFPLRIDPLMFGLARERFVEALQAEGIPAVPQYVKPLYLAPLFQQRIGLGRHGFPFTDPHNAPLRSYPAGLCPVAEALYQTELCYLPWCAYDFDEPAVDAIVGAIEKILHHRKALA